MDALTLIQQQLETINEAIRTTLPESRNLTLKGMETMGLDRTIYTAQYANNFNACLRNLLPDMLAESTWHVRKRTNATHLIDKETGLKVRMLKEYAFSGAVPPAGYNRARNEAWTQPALTQYESQPAIDTLPLENIEIIIVWAETGEQILATAYQPLTAGRFPNGANALTVMQMPIGIDNEDYNALKFTTDERKTVIAPARNTIVSNQTTPITTLRLQ